MKFKSLIGFLFFMGTCCGVSHAATFVVDRTDDVNPPASACTATANDCSLRGAISAANAAAGADDVTLPAGTYTLSIAGTNENANADGDLDTSGDLTLNGAGARTTIIEQGTGINERVLDIGPGTAMINHVTIRNGVDVSAFGGGGIRNSGTLTLSFCTVTNNESTFNAGGGIENQGTMTIDHSTVSNNRCNLSGGGIINDGPGLTIKNSTISGNNAIIFGGGLSNISIGAVLLIQNSTITANHADCGALEPCGTGDDSGNGGGIADAGSTLTLRNSIIAGNQDNSPAAGTIQPDCSATIVSEGHNIIQSTTGCTGMAASDLIEDPLLGALQDNGGETNTHALQSGSPAIDGGDSGAPGSGGTACESDDQRTQTRTACDIGAFEVICGDGNISGSEACDDGNTDNTDACTNTCATAACGDGFIQAGVEECDIGGGATDICASGSACAAAGGANACTCQATTAPPRAASGGCSLIRY